ncbi:hypothetical protein AB838_14400 [Rhodobacteraceae bacterium (ex Bugula neritina AB1)]|nr:hypothetical protein AB838_14400 [Rhodobacteraceae bacterium (ex Bugula neritina AB1)]
MKKRFAAPVALALIPAAAMAGGVDRSGQSLAPLFENGNYAEFSLGYVSPDVSGTALGVESGDMVGSHLQVGAAYKRDINDRLSFALIFDQPFGADVDYPAGTGYVFQGATAELNSNAISGVLRYKFNDNFSVHGGIRLQTLEAEVSIPVFGNYAATGDRDQSFGYLVGVAYERPDIALRIALTYFSEVDHDIDTVETGGGLPAGLATTTSISTPQAVNLDFQTGIAKDTLLFGQIRWVEWSQFNISPSFYTGTLIGAPLVSFSDDRYTYTLGVGRSFNENWSGSVSVSYEETLGGFQSNLSPTDGRLGLTIGAKYKQGNMTLSGGVNITRVGSAQTVVSRAPFATSAFGDNTSVGVGFKVGYNF